jgi:anti-sigma factor RsiW
MKCREAQRRLPGYLDAALGPGDRARLGEHLESCDACRLQLESYRKLAVVLAGVEPSPPPPDLALRIRVEVSRERARREARRLWAGTWVRFENFLQPLAVPATGGLLTAVLAFAIVAQSLLVGVPVGAVPNDLPTNLLQPARLESLAPFPAPGLLGTNASTRAGALVVQATLNSRGQVVNYEILSGPDDRAVRRQLDQVLLFSRFRPQMSFGRPTSGGHVIISFSEVRVTG